MYFESHAHYDDPKFDEDRDILLSKTLPEAGISHVINIGADMETSQNSVLLSQKYHYIYASVGVHPHEASSIKDGDYEKLKTWANLPKTVAIGEIGLDFYYDHSPRGIQRKRFKEMLEIAIILNKPVIIHSRDAAQETFDILLKSGIGSKCGGVVHCYSGSAEMAREYVKMGFLIGIGGVVTFPKSKSVCETVAEIPISSLLIETDCPYLSPVPNRGQRNSSQNLAHICEKIAQIKQISPSDVAKLTKENAQRLFSLK